MQDAIHLLTDSDSQHEAPVPELTKDSDPSEHLEDLLQSYRVAFPSGPPALNGTYTLQQRSSQAEVRSALHLAGCVLPLHVCSAVVTGM